MVRMLNPKEVATRLGISVSTLYSWVKQGKIPAYQYGQGLRFKEDEIENWLEQHRKVPLTNEREGNEQ